MGHSGQVSQGDQGSERSNGVNHTTHAMSPAMVYLIIAVIVLVMCLKALRKIIVFVSESVILMLIIRHFTGAHYHGKRITDATMWQHGSSTDRRHDLDGFMSRWEHKPRGHRALWRWACTLAFFGLVYGVFAARAVTYHAFEALVVYGIFAAVFVIEKKVRLRLHNRHVLNPIVKSLAAPNALRLSHHAVRRMVHIRPEDITDEGEVGYIELPPEITPGEDQQATVERIIDAHLPVDIEVDWRFQQSPKIGVIRAGLRPPAMVDWDEMVDAMTRAKYGDIVLGKNRFKEIFEANFIHLDDPHWAFSVQTKRGKSNFLGLVAVQVLHQDPLAQVTVIDPKEESLIDFLGAPWVGVGTKPLLKGVTMANDPENVEAMWDAIHRAKRMMDRRRSDYARDRTKKFPIHLVMIDELNMFKELTLEAWAAKLAANKRLDKEMQEDLPKECPVWADIRAMLHMGRFVGIHLICVAQDFRAEILGGHGARNGFGFRGMGGFLPSQWKMFIGTTPVPAAQVGVGRWIFWQGEQQDWVQITRCDAERAYAWAAHGRELHDADAALGYEPGRAELTDGSTGHTDLTASISAPDTSVMPDPGRRVVIGMREAARYLGMKPRSFETARRRTESDGTANRIPGEFEQGRNIAWYADDLDAWNRNRKGGTHG